MSISSVSRSRSRPTEDRFLFLKFVISGRTVRELRGPAPAAFEDEDCCPELAMS
jgi:hypothetical protein